MSRDRYDEQRRVSLLVRNIPLETRPEDLRAKFEKYGELRDVYLPRDYYTQRPKGFAFIEYRDHRDAQEAIHGLDRTEFGGREISSCCNGVAREEVVGAQVVESKEDRKTPREMRRRDDAPVGRPSRGYGGGGGGYGGGYDRGGDRYGSRGGDRGYDRGYRERSRSPPRRRSYSPSPPRRSSRRTDSRSPSPRRPASRSPSPRRDVPEERYKEKYPEDDNGAPAPLRDDDGYRSPRD